MLEQLKQFFSTEFFMPHGHCYLWQPALVWVQVLSNGSIALAYLAISSMLGYLVYRVRDIPFKLMYVAFGVFIVTCGFTHLMDVVVIWEPSYWVDGGIRAVTALASVGTAIMLPPLIPKAISLARGAKAAHDRGIELQTIVKDLGTMYERTKELEALKSQFFANISHELRTPLTLILAPTEKLLSAPNITPDQRRDLEVMLRNARSLLRQVNDLLDVSKLEAGKMEPEYAETDLAHLVRLTASQFETLAVDRKVTYTVQAPPTLPAQVDPDKLQRVLLNLLSNAFKFTPDGGTIRCEIRGLDPSAPNEDPKAVIEIADSGPGVPVQHRDAVFERFRQLEGGTTRRVGGTGLGLAIARDFTKMHRGDVVVVDAPEGGALFRVEVPVRAPAGVEIKVGTHIPGEARAEHLADELRPVAVPVPTTPGTSQGLVLVVEDNPEMNRFLMDTLATENRVASARNGAEGLRLARELHPDLILTDVMMPEMGGDDLLRAVKSDPGLRDIPVVVLTAKAEDDFRLQLLRAGAQDYVMKPFSAQEVRVRVHNLVSMKRARDLLRTDLESRTEDLEELADEVAVRQRELKTAIESLEVARDQALRASEVKTSFLSLVSHELRTPLTTVRLQVDRLARSMGSALTDTHSQVLSKLDAACSRLENMVNSLLEYARIESGRLSLQLESTQLTDVVREAVDDMRAQAEYKQLSLEVVGGDLPRIDTDPRIVRLVVVNLLGNAIKFTDKGGITVEAKVVGDLQQLSVTDTGPGIPREEWSRIFEPFEQLEAVRRKHTPGVGLGLALVREMVHALGGEVRVSSEIGRGSTFTVTLPSRQLDS